MARVAQIVGLIFTIAFTLIMASYTYNAWIKHEEAQKEVEIAQHELDVANNEVDQARAEYFNSLPVGAGLINTK